MRVVRVEESLLLAAAERLVSQSLRDRKSAARKLIASAPQHGIDLSLIWATLADDGSAGHAPGTVRQACLVIPGSGRTAMIFLSEPFPGGEPGGPDQARAERARLLREIEAVMLSRPVPDVRILQALPDPSDRWAIGAMLDAGFVHVGELEYRRRLIAPSERRQPPAQIVFPRGVRVVTLASIPESLRESLLIDVLDQTYANTLDCPELCGLRETRDILASHRGTGLFDPQLWFLVLDEANGDRPEAAARGCMLLSRVPEQRSLELVYIGLAPELRGRGLGTPLMRLLLNCAKEPQIDTVTCAVDRRNVPALRLYDRFGFASAGRRVALVRAVGR